MNRLKVPAVLVAVGLLLGLIAWTYFTSPTSSAGTVAATATTAPSSNGHGTTPSKHSAATTTSTRPAPTTTIAPNPTAYTTALYNDWAHHNKTAAASIAADAAVATLFRRHWRVTNGWVSQGCRTTAAVTVCTWMRPHWHLVVSVSPSTGKNPLRVTSVRFSH